MPFDFLSLPGFLFLFIVIGSGYFFTEVILGDKYFARKTFERYSNNLFDRILHYVFWGVSINIIFFTALAYDGESLRNLEEAGKMGRELAKAFPGGEAYGDQSYFFLFAFDYWGLLFLSLFSVLLAIRLPAIVEYLSGRFFKNT